jgi:hypothetical protein
LPIEAGSQILVTLHHGTSWMYPRILHLGFCWQELFCACGFLFIRAKDCGCVQYNPLGWTREEYIRFPLKNLVWLSVSLHFPLATWRQLFVAFNQFFFYSLQLPKRVPFNMGMLTMHLSTLRQWKFWWAWWRCVTGFECCIGGHWHGG